MEQVVFAEDSTEWKLLIRLAKFRSRVEAHVVRHAVVIHVVGDAAFEELQSFLDPFVTILVVVEFHRHVESQVVSLELPNFDEVRLNLRERLKRCRELVPVFVFLVFQSLHPEHVNSNAAQSHRSQFHGFAGRVNLGDARLSKSVLAAHLR